MNQTILYIDDNKIFGSMMKAFLLRRGFKISHVATLKDASVYLKSDTPDVVILDYMLEDGTTDEFAKSLRIALPQILIIMVSGVGRDTDDIDEIVKNGVVDRYVPKPFSPSDIQAVISDLEISVHSPSADE